MPETFHQKPGKEKSFILSDAMPRLEFTKPISLTIFGATVSVAKWRDLYFLYCTQVYQHKTKTFLKLQEYVLSRQSNCGSYISTTETGFISPAKIAPSVWIETHFSSKDIVLHCQKIGKFCKLDMSKIIIRFERRHEPSPITEAVKKNVPQKAIPKLILDVIQRDYRNGFRFDSTMVRLLSSKTGLDIDNAVQCELKGRMFKRNDDVYFLTDVIAEPKVLDDIVAHANSFLDEYHCFDLSELYYCEQNVINGNSIRDIEDFEDLFLFLYGYNEIRCVGKYGTRIVRKRATSLDDIFRVITERITSITHRQFEGVLCENDLLDEFKGFSANLLRNIIKDYTEDFVKTEINGVVCYQTLDSLGFSDEFSNLLIETLNLIDKLALSPSVDVLHTVLSIKMNVNFRAEYNIPDDKTFRRLIAVYYKGEPSREWKGGVFSEVTD